MPAIRKPLAWWCSRPWPAACRRWACRRGRTTRQRSRKRWRIFTNANQRRWDAQHAHGSNNVIAGTGCSSTSSRFMKVCCRTAPSTHRARCAPMAEPALCGSLHDVAPATWPACRRLLAMLDGIGPLPVSLLVVPEYHHRGCVDHGPAFVRALAARIARGDEVVLHGYHHLDERVPGSRPLDWLQRRVYTAGEGEFAALAAADAHHRLLRGWDMLTRRLHWPIAGFVAPAWLLGPGARAA